MSGDGLDISFRGVTIAGRHRYHNSVGTYSNESTSI